MAEIKINGEYVEGVRMGEDFLSSLLEPLTLKAAIENESRLEHGKRVVLPSIFFEARELTLKFVIYGNTQEEYDERMSNLLVNFYEGLFTLEIPKRTSEVFHLRYLGQAVTYGEDLLHTTGTIAAKFSEDNPANR